MRTNGMSLHKLPLFVWAIFVTAILLLLALPVLAGGFAPALNLAICWELLNNLTQSAGNLLELKILGILRDYTPEIICYSNLPLILSINNKAESKIGSYLAGLIEGDGTIIVPKTERSPKGKLNYPSIQIVFHLKDFPLALMIQKILGFGSIIRKKGVNAYIYTINNNEGLISIVNLINGKLRTPKNYAFQNLIDWLNNKKNLNLIKKDFDNSYIMSNSWLSGFIEADGHFSVRTTISTPYPKLECKLELFQRQNDHNGKNNLFFLELIAESLFTVVKPIRTNKPYTQYRLRTTNLKGNLALESYLNNFPLFGSKYLDSKDWLKVFKYFKLGIHTDKSSIGEIISIKSHMNDKRTILTWDHLQNFYNLDD